MNNKCRDCSDRPTQLETFDSLIQKAKAYSVVSITAVIIVGILIVFGVSLAKKEIPGISEMSLFVSIVLGVVATIVSIVSMLFSFYGLEKTEESERRQHSILMQMKNIEEDTLRSTKTIQDSMTFVLSDKNNITTIKRESLKHESNPADAD